MRNNAAQSISKGRLKAKIFWLASLILTYICVYSIFKIKLISMYLFVLRRDNQQVSYGHFRINSTMQKMRASTEIAHNCIVKILLIIDNKWVPN